jgi:hypothetical protein
MHDLTDPATKENFEQPRIEHPKQTIEGSGIWRLVLQRQKKPLKPRLPSASLECKIFADVH